MASNLILKSKKCVAPRNPDKQIKKNTNLETEKLSKKKIDVNKICFANRPKRVLAKIEANGSHVRRANGRSKFYEKFVLTKFVVAVWPRRDSIPSPLLKFLLMAVS